MYTIACIPAFNEENKIRNLVKETLRYVDKVIVCDDGSSDNTFSEAKSAGAHVIKHEKNKGKGAALKSLFNYVKSSNMDIVVTIDGDGQFVPEEIPKLVSPIVENHADVVIGYRYHDEKEMPSYRKIGNKFLDKMTNLAADLPFKDTQSGFRAYSKKAVELINFKSDGFGADSEILIDASQKGLKILEEQITVLYNVGGKTSTKNPVSHAGEVITSLIELIALRHPLRYLGIPGLILLVIGVFFGVSIISTFNVTRYFSIPFTLVSIGSLTLGLMLLLMSVVLFGIVRTGRRN